MPSSENDDEGYVVGDYAVLIVIVLVVLVLCSGCAGMPRDVEYNSIGLEVVPSLLH